MASRTRLSASVLRQDVDDLHDNYTLGKELGRGQFGVTYLATHNTTGIKYACKVISKKKMVTKEDAEDVEREVAIMYHLAGHPNVVKLLGAYEDKHNVQLVMELCEGGELFDRIVEKGHYTEKSASTMFRTLLKVVAQCHALGVMHRDLKPENFLLSSTKEDAVCKATDFGLSMFFTPGQHFTDVVGSAYYVAPEVLRRNYGPSADIWSVGVILYILLCGVPPFWAETEQDIYRAVLQGTYDLRSDPWNKISDGAKDCVRRLLKQDPNERMTALEALNHPWVREGGIAKENPIEDTVLRRLRKFNQMTKFKKMALKVIASNLTDHEIRGLQEMFKGFDKDNSGTITYQELSEGLKNLSLSEGSSTIQGTKMKPSEIKNLLDGIDQDQDGTISYEEFITATIHLNKLESNEHLFRAFQTFDKDGNGNISEEELKTALMESGIPMKDEEVKAMIADADKNKDGLINYEEFQAMMRKDNMTHDVTGTPISAKKKGAQIVYINTPT
eukprot:1191054-Prorocentrum_minimum.AAC.7